MPNERVVEIPWALAKLPQSGLVLDIGSCDATYLTAIVTLDRHLECLDPRDCSSSLPPEIPFHQQSLFGNSLPRNRFDSVLMLSVLEHLGLPTYGQDPLVRGDVRALAECWSLLKPHGSLFVTVPAGRPKVTSWYRQYSPERLERLFDPWVPEISYWKFSDGKYVEISREDVGEADYRDRFDGLGGAGVVAGVAGRRR